MLFPMWAAVDMLTPKRTGEKATSMFLLVLRREDRDIVVGTSTRLIVTFEIELYAHVYWLTLLLGSS